MASAELVVPADSLRTSTTAFEPDARSRMTLRLRADGTTSVVSLDERYAAVSGFELTMDVPLDIRVHFETAKNLYLYAWFVYRFYPVAEQQALATLEFALRERLALMFPDRFGSAAKQSSSLSRLLKTARNEKLITNASLRCKDRLAHLRAHDRAGMELMRKMQAIGLSEMPFDRLLVEPTLEDYAHDWLETFTETLPFVRNTYAHGTFTLHSNVLGTFEIVTDLVNQLYPANMTRKS